jgi:RNA polymerase sigma-70 factor (ECF subfamily)
MAQESHHIEWELMRLTAEGDMTAFKELVDKYQRAVINLAYRFLGSREEAEDIAQEVFLKVYKAAKRYKPEARFATWLFRITNNTCLNELRQRKRKQEISLEPSSDHSEKDFTMDVPAPEETRPDIQLEREERNQIIQKSLETLPPNQRMAFILKRFEGLSYQEIAEVLNTSVSAVESLLFRAKQNLRTVLSPYVKNA